MKAIFLAAALAASVAGAQNPARTSQAQQVPFCDESLRYSIEWPSGLSLGEAQMQASRTGDRWSFALSLDASIPGFTASDSYQAVAAGDFCSLEFFKQFTHGKRKAGEKTMFAGGTATRETLGGGGKSEMPVPACPRDALTYLYFLRREMSQGRVPGPQTVYLGAPYEVRAAFGGKQKVKVSDKTVEAERLNITYKGPKSQGAFELYLERDAARTPVMARVPFVAGTFVMELVR